MINFSVLWYVLVGIYGLLIGSFLNVVIYRVPRSMSVAFPPSHCPNCDAKIKWYDNIPVLSYIILGGKCRNCKEKISIRYTLVELLNTALWLLCWFRFWKVNLLFAFISMIASSVLISVFFIDLENKIIPDRFNVIILVLGVVACFCKDGVLWYERLIGLGVGLAIFLLFYYGSILILKKEGLGFGDVKFVAVCGLLLGFKNVLLAITVAAILGSVILVTVSLIKKKDKDFEFPFAPFLAVGVFVAMTYGNVIIEWYLRLITGG